MDKRLQKAGRFEKRFIPLDNEVTWLLGQPDLQAGRILVP